MKISNRCDAGCPRANQVLDKEHPNGDLSTPPSDLTVLQQHVVFWCVAL